MSITRLRALHYEKESIITSIHNIKNLLISRSIDLNHDLTNEHHRKIITILVFSDMSFCGTLNKANSNFTSWITKNTICVRICFMFPSSLQMF